MYDTKQWIDGFKGGNMDLVIASSNLHKIREIRGMLKNLPGVEVYSLRDFPNYESPEETGDTFEDNARIKAVHAAKTLNKRVVADDSGLVVPVLDDAPGVYSRRYAGEDSTDADNRKKLLKALEGKNDLQRAAYFVCCLVVSDPDDVVKSVTGRCEGVIATEERGANGFGYDSLFIKHDYDKTFAELDESVKNRISHRSKAIEKLSAFLEGELAKS